MSDTRSTSFFWGDMSIWNIQVSAELRRVSCWQGSLGGSKPLSEATTSALKSDGQLWQLTGLESSQKMSQTANTSLFSLFPFSTAPATSWETLVSYSFYYMICCRYVRSSMACKWSSFSKWHKIYEFHLRTLPTIFQQNVYPRRTWNWWSLNRV